MNLDEFNDYYLNILLQQISKEKKNVFLPSDFWCRLVKIWLIYILEQINLLTRFFLCFCHIFYNYVFKEVVCGNVTSTQFDHLPQDLFIPSVFSDNAATSSNIFERSWTNFNQAEVVVDYFD